MNTPIDSNENSVNQQAANEEIRAEEERLEMLSREEAASVPAGGNEPSRSGGWSRERPKGASPFKAKAYMLKWMLKMY